MNAFKFKDEELKPYEKNLRKIANNDYKPSEIDEQDFMDQQGENFEEMPFTDIESGLFFGDQALVEGNKRMYSLWATQDCHLFYFQREDFKDILKKQELRITQERIAFLSKIIPLNVLSHFKLKELSKHFRSMQCIRYKYLYTQEKEKAKFIYIVKDGEFQVTLQYSVKGPSYKETKQMEVFENPHDAKRHENELFLKNRRLEQKTFSLGTIQSNGFIGLEDIVLQS